MDISAIIASLLITGAILFLQEWRKRRFAASFRIEAEAAFAHLLSQLDGTNQAATNRITIVNEKEAIESSRGALLAYVLNRIVRMPSGEHYFFMFRSDATPYYKLLDAGTARILLGK